MSQQLRNLQNQLRETLSSYEINVDDIDSTKILQSCIKILDAIHQIEAERKALESQLEDCTINITNIAKKSGLDRKTIERNGDFKKIIEMSKTDYHEETEIERLKCDKQKLLNAYNDFEEQQKASLEAKQKVAELTNKLRDVGRELVLAKEDNLKKLNTIQELKAELARKEHIQIPIMSGNTSS